MCSIPQNTNWNISLFASIALLLIIDFNVISAQLLPESPKEMTSPWTPQKQRAASSDEILYEQTMPTNNGAPIQKLEPSLSDFDSEMADDFIVPPGGNRSILSFQPMVICNGTFCTASTADDLFMSIYEDDGGRPGSLIFADTFANFSYPIPALTPNKEYLLSPGTYWIGIQIDKDFQPFNTQVFWASSNDNTAGPGVWHWRNPNGGFGTPCNDWEDGANACVSTSGPVGGGAGVGAIMALRLSAPVITEPIPTLSQWSFIVLILLFMCVCVVIISQDIQSSKGNI